MGNQGIARHKECLADDICEQGLNQRSFARAGRQTETEIQRLGIIHKILYLGDDAVLALQHLAAGKIKAGLRLAVPLHSNHKIVKGVLPRIEVRLLDKLVHIRSSYLFCLLANPAHVVVNRLSILLKRQDTKRIAQTFLGLHR